MLIKHEDLLLVKNSRIIKDYPILQKVDENQVSSNSQTLDEKTKRFGEYNFSKILSKAKEEWFLNTNETQYYIKSKIDCQFCGYKNIKNVCVIENRYTDKKITVGTECLKKTGLSRGINVNKILVESKKEKRLKHIESIFPGIKKEIQKWDSFLEARGISNREKVAQQYIELGIKAKKTMEAYINSNTSELKAKELLVDMGEIMRKGEIEKRKMSELKNSNFDLTDERVLA